MSKSHRYELHAPKPKPGQVKRLQQRDAMQQYRPKDYPEREAPAWKPLG
ncbi:hypothetical protein PSQ40_06755 [Curvibacter sp. HBC61]|uniref:Uncharacterized protein n=1 Tax=Curvibacter cyanobacteriorum TaxID=3026422 RepID=A0ABT5MYA0_9BURK|nr:hypothetical protein [Curvibacter sp. HBC61]MDD0838266.1 hypothetical protein [Curvibacter sp. HBC61]